MSAKLANKKVTCKQHEYRINLLNIENRYGHANVKNAEKKEKCLKLFMIDTWRLVNKYGTQ